MTQPISVPWGKQASKTLAIALLLSLAGATPAFADLLNLTSVTPGSSGSFTGTLDGVTVAGFISTTTPNFVFNPSASTPHFIDSSVNATSPQYSYSSVYAVTAPLADQVGYTTLVGTANPATITINFGSAIVNPIFQVANLDGMRYDFSPTAGLGGLVLLSGNGGADNDGILLTGDVISDANTGTIIGVDPATAPPLTGRRSAYGSVELVGSFTQLTIDVSNPGDLGDGGSFTLAASPVPEPWSVTLFGTLCAFFLFHLRRRAGALK